MDNIFDKCKITEDILSDWSILAAKVPPQDKNVVVKRTGTKNSIALEQIIKKDCKDSGGVGRFIKNEDTFGRLLITRHLMA